MQFLEKNLEDILFETDNDILSDRNLSLDKYKKRQVKIGNYGIADMVCWERRTTDFFPCEDNLNNKIRCPECKTKICEKTDYIHIQIIELKQNEININSFLQAIKYCAGILSYLEKRKFEYPINIQIVLIGSKVNDGDFIYLPDIINSDTDTFPQKYDKYKFDLSYYTYKYEVDGINFNQEDGYKLINEGFNIKSK